MQQTVACSAYFRQFYFLISMNPIATCLVLKGCVLMEYNSGTKWLAPRCYNRLMRKRTDFPRLKVNMNLMIPKGNRCWEPTCLAVIETWFDV